MIVFPRLKNHHANCYPGGGSGERHLLNPIFDPDIEAAAMAGVDPHLQMVLWGSTQYLRAAYEIQGRHDNCKTKDRLSLSSRLKDTREAHLGSVQL